MRYDQNGIVNGHLHKIFYTRGAPPAGVATLTSLLVSPTDPTTIAGLSRQFVATGVYSDGTSQDITDSVTWSSSMTSFATIGANNGLAMGVAAGTSNITATLGLLSDNTDLTVTAATLASITVTPANSTIASGLTRQFLATGIDTEGISHDITATVTWSSDSTDFATVNSAGLALGVTAGASAIRATAPSSVTGATTLTVTGATLDSISVTPANPSVVNGLTRQFTATGIYSDGTSQDITASAVWSTVSSAIATINASGLATGEAAGTTSVRAALSGINGATNLTVTAETLSSIAVAPLNPSVVSGLNRQFTATGTYSNGSVADISSLVVWSSSDIARATMNPNGTASSGLATGIAVGTASISAAMGGQTGTTTLNVTAATLSSIAVTPVTPSVAMGLTRQFAATGTYSNGSVADITASVVWSSSDITRATMNPSGTVASGLATGILNGTSVIRATLGSVIGNTTLTVTAVTLSSIAVTPENSSVASGLIRQFTATGTYSDSSEANITALVIWASSDITRATMNPNGTASSGRATGVSVGTSTITATLGADSDDTTLTVTAALANNPTPPDLGETERFVVLASQAITTTPAPISSIADGDFGLLDQARSFYAGFTPGVTAGQFVELTNGLSYAPDDVTPPYIVPAPYASTVAFINQVRTDLGIAYTFLAADPNPGAATQVLPVELGNQTLTRGVYKTASNVTIQTGDLTLDAQGDPDSVWIFSIGGTLATGAPGGNIILAGGALSKNVYWRTAGTTIVGTNTTFRGNVFAWPQVNVTTGATVVGRLFSVTEQVTLDNNMVTKAP